MRWTQCLCDLDFVPIHVSGEQSGDAVDALDGWCELSL